MLSICADEGVPPNFSPLWSIKFFTLPHGFGFPFESVCQGLPWSMITCIATPKCFNAPLLSLATSRMASAISFATKAFVAATQSPMVCRLSSHIACMKEFC